MARRCPSLSGLVLGSNYDGCVRNGASHPEVTRFFDYFGGSGLRGWEGCEWSGGGGGGEWSGGGGELLYGSSDFSSVLSLSGPTHPTPIILLFSDRLPPNCYVSVRSFDLFASEFFIHPLVIPPPPPPRLSLSVSVSLYHFLLYLSQSPPPPPFSP